ncbi:hypothetical protein BJ165DRAFT_1446145, partial [Panaeolus papilionaceus]
MIPGRSVAFLLGVLPWLVSAQRATCLNNSTFDWTFNQQKQSPCDVAIALGAVCAGPTFTLQALPPTFIYLGPFLGFANPCRCSSVYYSMLAACSLCQDRDWLKWSAYNTNCTTVYDQNFPSPLPSNTGVPSYAYLSVTPKDSFDPVAAQAVNVQTNPDSTAIPAPTSNGNLSPTFANNTPGQSAGKKTNVGAIVGGVIGGVLLLGLIIAFVVWILLKKKRAQQQQNYAPSDSSREKQALNQQSYTSSPFQPQTPMTQAFTGGSTTPFVPPAQSQTPFAPSTKLYDPNDPSTFPAIPVQDGGYAPQAQPRPFSPPGSTVYTSSPEPSHQVAMHVQPLSPSFTGTSSSLQARTHYTGAPEL